MEVEQMNQKQRRAEEKYYMRLYHSQDKKSQDEAKYYFIKNHENFIKSQMKKFCPTYIKDYYEDLFENGIVGILEALKKFNPENGLFITWSKFYIMHEFQKYICEMILQCSEHYARLQNKIRKVMNKLKNEGLECTVYNICEHTGLNPQIVKRELWMQKVKIISLETLPTDLGIY